MLYLDDLLGGSKEPPPILDFSKYIVKSEEEFRKLRDQVADYKIRPEKVKPDEIRIQERGFSWKPRGRELRRQRRQRYPFANPVPVEMRHSSIASLAAVTIDWRMLTSDKPKAKQDEEYFSKLITMAKSQIRSNIQERRAEIRGGTGISFRPSIFSRGRGRRKCCLECGEELCSGSRCGEYSYDASARIDEFEEKTERGAGDRGKQDGLSRKRRKKRRRKRNNKRDEVNSEKI